MEAVVENTFELFDLCMEGGCSYKQELLEMHKYNFWEEEICQIVKPMENEIFHSHRKSLFIEKY